MPRLSITTSERVKAREEGRESWIPPGELGMPTAEAASAGWPISETGAGGRGTGMGSGSAGLTGSWDAGGYSGSVGLTAGWDTEMALGSVDSTGGWSAEARDS
jgi:hypothetical protein